MLTAWLILSSVMVVSGVWLVIRTVRNGDWHEWTDPDGPE